MQFLLKKNKSQVQDILIQKGILTADDMITASTISAKKGMDVFDYLIKEDVIDAEDIVKTVAGIANLPYINLKDSIDLNPQTLKLLPREIAEEYQAVPLGLEKNVLVVAMVDADDVQKVDYLSQVLGRRVSVYMASKRGISNALRQYEIEIREADILASMGLQKTEEDSRAATSKSSFLAPFRRGPVEDVQTLASESPASQALNNVLQYAVGARASDIHIEAMEDSVRVRVRVDGVMSVVASFPKALEAALITKVKILSKLKVDEKRLPQDGEFVINVYGNNIDLRIAISPTIWGEQVIIRILDRSGTVTGLENLGYSGLTLKVIRDSLKNSSGMVLTSGPTGSGKTTTLYTLLREVAQGVG